MKIIWIWIHHSGFVILKSKHFWDNPNTSEVMGTAVGNEVMVFFGRAMAVSFGEKLEVMVMFTLIDYPSTRKFID